MNDQIIHSLVESYKEKGISTHNLLKDPLFLSLPVEKQVEAVQAYAGVLAQNSKIPTKSKVLTKAIISGATSGAIASVPFTLGYSNPQTRLALGIGSTVLGGMIGGVSGLLMHKAEKDRFETTNKYLIRLSKASNPDIPTSVKVLDANRKYEPRTVNSIVRSMGSPESALIDKAVALSGKVKEPHYKNLDKGPSLDNYET